MREIKFRAWTKDEMIYEGWNKNFFVNKGIVFRYDDVMQYTGLKDKNGKEIYEGDIVRCSDWVEDAHCNNSWVRTVEWDLDNGMWLGVDGETNEVIGNIYETTQLIP